MFYYSVEREFVKNTDFVKWMQMGEQNKENFNYKYYVVDFVGFCDNSDDIYKVLKLLPTFEIFKFILGRILQVSVYMKAKLRN